MKTSKQVGSHSHQPQALKIMAYIGVMRKAHGHAYAEIQHVKRTKCLRPSGRLLDRCFTLRVLAE